MLLPHVRFGHGDADPHSHFPMSCPSLSELTVVAVGLGLLVSLIAGVVGHGVLQPLMEARGVRPWALRDSLGSMPLVLIGSWFVGAASAVYLALGITKCQISVSCVALLSIVIVVGFLMIRLGLLALRKLV